ncbi:MAG: abortive infection family protein [Pseudomonadota bacterium]
MKTIKADIEAFLATATEVLKAQGLLDVVSVLKEAAPTVEETGFDRWDGGTPVWTIYLWVDSALFAHLGAQREELESQVAECLKPIIEPHDEDWFKVKIVPQLSQNIDWRHRDFGVPEAIRRNIIDGLKIENVNWRGRLNDIEFLERMFDLKSMPTYDSRYSDAYGDIWQHTINNDDYEDDWIYTDKRFGLIAGDAAVFLRFLCETVHPVVRADRNDALKIVQNFNDQLRQCGWELVEEEMIAGRPRYTPRRMSDASQQSVSRARKVADALSARWMHNEIIRLENAVERDPALAIGTAKDLVESCCKSILEKRNVPVPKNANLQKLSKLIATELKLVPQGISDEAKGAETIRLLLSNLSSITHYTAELRGLYGSGHGRDGKHRGLEPRHARLAVGAAVTFIDFVTSTYKKQSDNEQDD